MTKRNTDELIEAALQHDSRAVARLISLVEDGHSSGADILSTLFPLTGSAHVVGLTGPPGSGKSTLTDQLIGLRNMVLSALIVARSAMENRRSLGCHYREDGLAIPDGASSPTGSNDLDLH